MKNFIYTIIISTICLVTFSGCEEEVFPKGDLRNEYIFNCVLNGDTSYQVATLTRSYDVTGFDPYENTNSPAVKGARIRLLYEGDYYEFRDTTVQASAGSRYEGELYYYYINNFKPAHNKIVEAEIETPEGTILHSTARTFPVYLTNGSFYRSDQIIPPVDPVQTEIVFKWADFTQLVYYVPKLVIRYSKVDENNSIIYKCEVPRDYFNGKLLEPQLEVGDNITYWMPGFEYAMGNIALDSISRANTVIRDAYFSVLFVDDVLATYYSAAKTFSDNYSVQLVEPEYTNIEGGLGLFASYSTSGFKVKINTSYIRSFGYLDETGL